MTRLLEIPEIDSHSEGNTCSFNKTVVLEYELVLSMSVYKSGYEAIDIISPSSTCTNGSHNQSWLVFECHGLVIE